MKITRKSLDEAVDEHIISAEQANRLYEHLASRPGTGPVFNFTNVLYYLGGLIAIGAMTLFMNLGWSRSAAGAYSLSRWVMRPLV